MKLILEFLIRYYVNRYSNKEITKLTDEEELNAYLFKTSASVLKILKSNITLQTLRHFEARTEQERWMVKGAALALQLIKDRHFHALAVNEIKDKDKKMKAWGRIKLGN